MRIKSAALLAAILAATAGQAMAYETGDIVLRAGVASVNPDVTDNVAGGALKLDVDNNEAVEKLVIRTSPLQHN